MWEELQERQSVLKMEINRREKAKRKQQTLAEQLETALHKKQEYWTRLKEEQKDVEDLDRFSILKVVRTWTGKQDVIREKEISELAAIEAKYREIEKTVIDLEKDITVNERELEKGDWESLDLEWKQIIEKKKQWLLVNNHAEATRLERLYEQKTILATSIREIIEAITAGNEAKIALKRALKSLEGAKDYSTWDTFLGGGIIATSLKHSKLDESEEAIHYAQRSLQRFHTELLDIQKISIENIAIERESFVTFADYVFDDIFSAWSTHSKINNSIDRMEQTLQNLSSISDQLQKQLKETQEKQSNVEIEIAQIIEY
ncbi:hypothetical protein [Psychrobacillus psychrodurans]|uniref:hypothetical protein n=1 Tax=Psychrobacillus psychrodurans TaxID=126157 RepID=UPI0008E64EF5|nr:hypothetical protein [Psychrobacillus psychrodurans]MCZ8541333.1 hypothetical protein [Psychrobacillus psychrodurans]SFM96461.1 hypothetical protein SAMN05421832_11026 [Psychrobacillus psychrodurans]